MHDEPGSSKFVGQSKLSTLQESCCAQLVQAVQLLCHMKVQVATACGIDCIESTASDEGARVQCWSLTWLPLHTASEFDGKLDGIGAVSWQSNMSQVTRRLQTEQARNTAIACESNEVS